MNVLGGHRTHIQDLSDLDAILTSAFRLLPFFIMFVPMPTFAPVDEQLTYLKKGAAEIIREANLRPKRKPFQDVGHTVVFLIGDLPGKIGGPTGGSATRPPLTREQIELNAETYKA